MGPTILIVREWFMGPTLREKAPYEMALNSVPEIWCIQCPLDIATLDKAAALPIATSTPVTDLRHYINSNLVYNDLKI